MLDETLMIISTRKRNNIYKKKFHHCKTNKYFFVSLRIQSRIRNILCRYSKYFNEKILKNH